MSKAIEKKNWVRKHPVLVGVIIFFVILIILIWKTEKNSDFVDDNSKSILQLDNPKSNEPIRERLLSQKEIESIVLDDNDELHWYIGEVYFWNQMSGIKDSIHREDGFSDNRRLISINKGIATTIDETYYPEVAREIFNQSKNSPPCSCSGCDSGVRTNCVDITNISIESIGEESYATIFYDLSGPNWKIKTKTVVVTFVEDNFIYSLSYKTDDENENYVEKGVALAKKLLE